MLNWVATRVKSALAQAPGTRCLSITVSSGIRPSVLGFDVPWIHSYSHFWRKSCVGYGGQKWNTEARRQRRDMTILTDWGKSAGLLILVIQLGLVQIVQHLLFDR